MALIKNSTVYKNTLNYSTDSAFVGESSDYTYFGKKVHIIEQFKVGNVLWDLILDTSDGSLFRDSGVTYRAFLGKFKPAVRYTDLPSSFWMSTSHNLELTKKPTKNTYGVRDKGDYRSGTNADGSATTPSGKLLEQLNNKSAILNNQRGFVTGQSISRQWGGEKDGDELHNFLVGDLGGSYRLVPHALVSSNTNKTRTIKDFGKRAILGSTDLWENSKDVSKGRPLIDLKFSEIFKSIADANDNINIYNFNKVINGSISNRHRLFSFPMTENASSGEDYDKSNGLLGTFKTNNSVIRLKIDIYVSYLISCYLPKVCTFIDTAGTECYPLFGIVGCNNDVVIDVDSVIYVGLPIYAGTSGGFNSIMSILFLKGSNNRVIINANQPINLGFTMNTANYGENTLNTDGTQKHVAAQTPPSDRTRGHDQLNYWTTHVVADSGRNNSVILNEAIVDKRNKIYSLGDYHPDTRSSDPTASGGKSEIGDKELFENYFLRTKPRCLADSSDQLWLKNVSVWEGGNKPVKVKNPLTNDTEEVYYPIPYGQS